MYRVITTVGTSLITNYQNIKIINSKGYPVIKEDTLKRLDKLTLEQVKMESENVVKDLKNILDNWWIKGIRKVEERIWEKVNDNNYNVDCCAEIKTLLEFYKKINENNDENLEMGVYLIATDTPKSVLAAKLIKENISNFNENIKIIGDIKVAKGLQTDDFERFNNEGINELFNGLLEIIREIDEKNNKKDNQLKSDKIKTVINISGGYKAIIPYMTIFAQVYNLDSIYIYEDSSSLITIPSLPIQIDWAFAEEYYPYLDEPTIIKDMKKQNYLVNKGLLNNKNNRRTPLGNFFRQAIERNLYVADSVMGFLFEYKVYEYYINNYLDEYKMINRSEYIENEEFDVVLRKEEKNNDDYIVVEVKSLNYLDRGRISRLRCKIKKQLEALKKFGCPKEYHLCVYTPNKDMFDKLDKLSNFKIRELENFREIFKDAGIKFRAFIIKANYNINEEDRIIDENKRDSNPYQQLMRDKLVFGKDLKEIDF